MAFFKMTPRSRRPLGARRPLPTLPRVEELETRNLMSFTLGPILSSGSVPLGITATDLTGNGKQDLVFTNFHQGVSVILGNGDGTFGSRQAISLESYSGRVAVADVNGDGKPDLATDLYGSGKVSVLLGNGNGTFKSPQLISPGATPVSIFAGDFNGDGNMDLATPTSNDMVSVLLSNGNGTFQSPQLYPGTHGLGTTADFNGDGLTDIAVADYSNNTITILLNSATTQYQVKAPGSTTAGQVFSLTVTAQTASQQTDTHYSGTVHFTSADPNAFLPADYTSTAADKGVHTFTGLALEKAGTETITATDTESSSVTFTAKVHVHAAEATHFLIKAPTSVSARVPFNVTITALDTYGNVAVGYIGTAHFTSTDSSAVLPTDYTFQSTDKGKHTFSVTLNTAGSETITVADTIHSTVSGQVNVTVGSGGAAPASSDPGDSPWTAVEAYFAGEAFEKRRLFVSNP
jgi:hypothetical protein